MGNLDFTVPHETHLFLPIHKYDLMCEKVLWYIGKRMCSAVRRSCLTLPCCHSIVTSNVMSFLSLLNGNNNNIVDKGTYKPYLLRECW